MASPRRRSHTKPAPPAADEFWRAPAPQHLTPSAIDGDDLWTEADINQDNDNDSVAATVDADKGEYFEVVSLPPAHRQLLSSDLATVEDLKGYDHTFKGYDHASGVGRDEEGCAGDKSSCLSRRGPSPADRQSGGSWLMGIIGLDDSIAPEVSLDDSIASRLSLDSYECSSSSDDDSLPAARVDKPARRGVSFNTAVVVQPIPHSSELSERQRRRMYATTQEVRRNKARNRREFRHDGCDWREATEEWEMAVDMATGELVHPAHGKR